MIFRLLFIFFMAGAPNASAAIHPNAIVWPEFCGRTLREVAAELREVFPLEVERKILPYRSYYVNLDNGDVYEAVRASHPVAALFFREFPGLYPLLTLDMPLTLPGIGPLHRELAMFGEIHSGKLDETERRMTDEERSATDLLLAEGWNIKAKPEGLVEGQRCPEGLASLLVEGGTLVQPVEIKSPNPKADHNTIRNEINNSLKGGGQAPYMLIDARGTTLTAEDAVRGVRRIVGLLREGGSLRPTGGHTRLHEVRIVGDDYDFTWHFYTGDNMLDRAQALLRGLGGLGRAQSEDER